MSIQESTGKRFILDTDGNPLENFRPTQMREDTDYCHARRAESNFYLDDNAVRLRNWAIGQYLYVLTLADKLPPFQKSDR